MVIKYFQKFYSHKSLLDSVLRNKQKIFYTLFLTKKNPRTCEETFVYRKKMCWGFYLQKQTFCQVLFTETKFLWDSVHRNKVSVGFCSQKPVGFCSHTHTKFCVIWFTETAFCGILTSIHRNKFFVRFCSQQQTFCWILFTEATFYGVLFTETKFQCNSVYRNKNKIYEGLCLSKENFCRNLFTETKFQ